MTQVLHIDLVLLREDVTEADRAALYEEATLLAALDGVDALGVIECEADCDFEIAFFFVLRSFAELEAFGTDPRYIRFLQGGIARSLRSFAGADVRLQGPWPGAAPHGACIALMATPQTYDWQVSGALQGWLGATGVGGLAVGERQRYRGVGMTFSNLPIPRPQGGFEGFGLDFISGRCRLFS